MTFTTFSDIDRMRRLREAASDVGPSAQLVAETRGVILLMEEANGRE